MKSISASQRTLTCLLMDSVVSLILLEDIPTTNAPQPVTYDGSGPTEIQDWTISGRRATNAQQTDLPRNRGTTIARVSAWAIVDAAGLWLYSERFPQPFDVAPNTEPYLGAGDIVIED